MIYKICTIHAESISYGPTIPIGEIIRYRNNFGNVESPCSLYQDLLERHDDAEILIYIHNDVTIHDPQWLNRVLKAFEPSIFGAMDDRYPNDVVAVGLGGATALGNKDLYRKKYSIWNMARHGYASNQTDAEVHGERFTGVRQVAVLDAFLMAVRVDWLRSIGGWPTKHLTHHCLDLWLACEAARHHKQIWMVGASCTHHGGGTSTKPSYQNAAWLQGGSLESDHQLPHKWLYQEYPDVLPIIV